MKLKQSIYSLAAVIMVLFSIVSCNDETETTTVTLDKHCAINAVVLGNLTRTITTKSTYTGKDTTYAVNVAGSVYPMYIDHLKGEIYNPDSLPVGTDPKRIIFSSISSDGSVYYTNSDGVNLPFTGKDSINFTQPVKFTCYSTDGSQSKVYTMRVNIHKSKSEDFTWTSVCESNTEFNGVTSQKAFVVDDHIVILAVKDGTPVCINNTHETPEAWNCTQIQGLSAINPANVQLFKGKFYTIENGNLMSSTDGIKWENDNLSISLVQLLAASANEIYAYDGSQILVSKDAANWSADTSFDNLDFLPTNTTMASASSSMTFNENFTYIILGGRDKNGNSVIWKKTIDKLGANTDPWTTYQQSAELKRAYPALSQATIMQYDGKFYSLGMTDAGLSNFYVCSDGGRSWVKQPDELINLRDESAMSYSAVVDKDNYIWIVYAPSGKVVKGRLNRLSFAQNQTVFLKGNNTK